VVLYEIYIKYLGAEILLTLIVVKVASADAQRRNYIYFCKFHENQIRNDFKTTTYKRMF
jgi:hypothetical protein